MHRARTAGIGPKWARSARLDLGSGRGGPEGGPGRPGPAPARTAGIGPKWARSARMDLGSGPAGREGPGPGQGMISPRW